MKTVNAAKVHHKQTRIRVIACVEGEREAIRRRAPHRKILSKFKTVSQKLQ